MNIDRNKLASLLVLADEASKTGLNYSKSIKLSQLVNEFKQEILEFYKIQEIKEIGTKYTQSNLFK